MMKNINPVSFVSRHKGFFKPFPNVTYMALWSTSAVTIDAIQVIFYQDL